MGSLRAKSTFTLTRALAILPRLHGHSAGFLMETCNAACWLNIFIPITAY